jgi:hypothetical protein
MRKRCNHRRERQLDTLGAIKPASPRRAFRILNVRDPFLVPGKFHIPNGKPSQVGNELTGFCIIADQFTARLHADHKKFLAILARQNLAKLQRARSQPDWFAGLAPERLLVLRRRCFPRFHA